MLRVSIAGNMSQLFRVWCLIVAALALLDIHLCESNDNFTSLLEAEATTGCPTPDLRFARPRKTDTATATPYAEFETTQIYLPEDFTTSDVEIVEKVDSHAEGAIEHGEDSTVDSRKGSKHSDTNPSRSETDGDDDLDDVDESGDGSDGHESSQTSANNNNNGRRRGKKRRFSGGNKRRRVENEHGGRGGGGGGGRGGRYEREAIYKSDSESVDEIKHLPKEASINHDDEYYIEIDHIMKDKKRNSKKLAKSKSKKKALREEPTNPRDMPAPEAPAPLDETLMDLNVTDDALEMNSGNMSGTLQRVKRKSGKTTGALSRPKGGGDSGSKSTSRKSDKGGFDEEGGGYVPVHSEDESEEEEEKSEEITEGSHFSEVSEIRFPGEVGTQGDRRQCKIRCVKGKWVGPLCAVNEEDGRLKYQPLYKSCKVNRLHAHLLLSYRNISVNVGWDLPHGHSLQARCKELGLYKLLGESRVLCSNGLWAPRMPSCVPTSMLSNYSEDSPPSIRIKIGTGSGAFEPSGVLAVLPGSTLYLDCMYPRRRGNPEWTWTGWFNQYYTGWSTIPEEKGLKYRLTIKDIQNQDSGTYTCATPRGLTNSIVIVVATSQCPQMPETTPPLTLRLEGNKLGQRALYSCPLGYTIEGTVNSTCLASGNWSSPPPSCHPVQCPPLFLEDPHLSLTELNTSAWGRAVFKCSWGFRLSGPPGLECEPSGEWSGPVPRCRAIQCPQPLVPLNGRIDGTSGSSSHRKYAVGALVTFSCTEGHILEGEASIVCTETGFWSHPPPFCKSQCPYPGDPPNGLIAPLKFHYDPGDLLSVQCRPGFVEYSTSGPPERPSCLPDGNWSGPVPQCRSYEEV